MNHSKIEYEKIVLNSIIEYPDNNIKYANEKMFASTDNKIIFNAIQDLTSNHEAILIDSINRKIPTGSQVALLETCSAKAVENIQSYATILKELSVKRDLEKILDTSSKEMEIKNAYELLDDINSSIKSINNSCGFATDYDYFGIQKLSDIEEKEPIFLMQSSLPVAENTVTILAGSGGAGKSLITLQMAIRYAVSTGRDAFCWLSEDSLAMSQKRARMICKLLGYDPESVMKKVWISAKTPFSIVNKGRDGMKINHEWIKFKQATKSFGFIVLDPLISFMSSLDENSNTDAKAIMKEIVDFSREDEKTLVIIHHSAKGTNSTRGAGAIKDAVRLVYNVKSADGLMRDIAIEKDNNNVKAIIGADGINYQIL